MIRTAFARMLPLVLALAMFTQAARATDTARVAQTVTLPHVKVVFDAPVDAPEDTNAPPLKLSTKQFDLETVKSLFFKGVAVEVKVKQMPSGPELIDGLPNTDTTFNVNGTLSWFLIDGSFIYNSDATMYNSYLFREAFKDIQLTGGFDWMTPQQALDLVCERARAIGLEPGELLAFQPLTKEMMRPLYEEEHRADPEGSPSADPPAEGYWINMALNLNGLGLMREPYKSALTRDAVRCGTLYAFVTQAGIQVFQTDELAYQVVEVGEGKPSISLAEAIEQFTKQHEKIIQDEPVVVKRIAYEYVPVPVKGTQYLFKARPAWCFYTVGEGLLFDVRSQYRPVYIDAITGEKIT